MTEREALKLALEALRQIDEAMPFPVAKLAQKAIKEALAQQETPNEIGKRVAREGGGLSSLWSAVSHDSDLPEAQRGYEEALAQPEQEPVAWMVWGENNVPSLTFTKPSDKYVFDSLYMTPPQRRWLGLSDEERSDIYNQTDWNLNYGWDYEQAIEAKLKEKNNA